MNPSIVFMGLHLCLTALAVAVTGSGAAGAAPAAHPQSHRAESRVAYLKTALQAVRSSTDQARAQAFDYARALDHGACSSGVERLRVECLMTAARRYCQKKTKAETRLCQVLMDVVVSNVLADPRLISTDKRYDIMRRYKDHRRELAHEIRRIQGALAVDFRLRMGDAIDDQAMAKNIDQYCLVSADDTNLAWQICAASLVWFIGTNAARDAAITTRGPGGGP